MLSLRYRNISSIRWCYDQQTITSTKQRYSTISTISNQYVPDISYVDHDTNPPKSAWDRMSAIVYPNVISSSDENIISSILLSKFQRYVKFRTKDVFFIDIVVGTMLSFLILI